MGLFHTFLSILLFTFNFTSVFNTTSSSLVDLTINIFNEQKFINLLNYNNSQRKENENEKDFNHWIRKELQISNDHILSNIRNNLSLNNQHNFYPFQNDINLGVIIASNSHCNPNYFFQWIRDSSITSLYLISFGLPTNFTLYNNLLLLYINNSKALQRIDNNSGNFSSVHNWTNLGEPKFYCNNTRFDSVWGRPQNDGPALRLISILTYLAKTVPNNNNNNNTLSTSLLDEICQFDLQFVLMNWNLPTFDPWEEIYSLHFFNNMVHLYSLKLYQSLVPNNKHSSSINRTIDSLEIFIKNEYVDSKQAILIETPTIRHTRPSQLDIAVVIASLITHPIDSLQLGIQMPFDVDDPLVLNVLYRLIQSMKSLYPINHNKNLSGAVALGRYPEDVYDGIDVSEGNPWFLTTCQGANLLYRLIKSLIDKGADLSVVLEENSFWNLFFQVDSSLLSNTTDHYRINVTLPYNSNAFNDTLRQIFNFADGFIQIIKTHVNSNGEMSEQFNKHTGYLTGASNLTWSYVEFVNAIKARDTISHFFSFLV